MHPSGVNLWFFKLSLLDLAEFIVWNNKGIKHWVAKILRIRKLEFVAKTQFLYVFQTVKVPEKYGVGRRH